MLKDWQFLKHRRAKGGQSSSRSDTIKIADNQIAVCLLLEAPGWPLASAALCSEGE